MYLYIYMYNKNTFIFIEVFSDLLRQYFSMKDSLKTTLSHISPNLCRSGKESNTK